MLLTLDPCQRVDTGGWVATRKARGSPLVNNDPRKLEISLFAGNEYILGYVRFNMA